MLRWLLSKLSISALNFLRKIPSSHEIPDTGLYSLLLRTFCPVRKIKGVKMLPVYASHERRGIANFRGRDSL